MILAATWFDAGLVLFHGSVLLAIAVYFRGERRRADAASRPVGWLPIAVSIPALALPWATTVDLSGGGYELGHRLWIGPLALLVALPVVLLLLVPLAQRLGGASPLDYLELRFGRTVRSVAAVLYAAGRCGAAAAMLAWCCRLATDGAGVGFSPYLLLPAVGGVAIAVAVLGGRRGLPWVDAWQSLLLVGGLALALGLLWSQPGGGPDAIAETARKLGRTPPFDIGFRSPDGWSLLAAFPGYLTLGLAFFGVDLTVHERWSVAGRTEAAQRGLLVGGVGLACVAAVAVSIGLGLLDFYHRQPAALRGRWVANLDSATRRSLTDPATRRRPLVDPRTGEPVRSLLDDSPALDPVDGVPLLDWYADEVDARTAEGLIAERRLLRPNNKQPVEQMAELIDPASGRFDASRLAMRRPTAGRELIMNRRATGELLPWFVATQAPWGVAAVCACGLLACGLSTTAGTARSVGRLLPGGPQDGSTEDLSSDLRTGATGAAIVGAALLMLIGDVGDRLFIPLASLALTPLLIAVALGLTARRGSTATAVGGMTSGLLTTVAVLLIALNSPANRPIHPLLAAPAGLAVGWLVGALAALTTRPKPRSELLGLVLGCGPLGVRDARSALGAAGDFLLHRAPGVPPAPPSNPGRWRQ